MSKRSWRIDRLKNRIILLQYRLRRSESMVRKYVNKLGEAAKLLEKLETKGDSR